MAKAGNNHFVRSTKARAGDVLSIGGTSLWSSCSSTFLRIDAVCGDGASRVFAEPNIKRQEDGSDLNVAWFGSYDEEPRQLDSLDRAMRARVQADLVTKLDRLGPALSDAGIGETVAAMLNLYDDKSIMAVGEHAILTNWGILPAGVASSQAAFGRHSELTIGQFLRSGISPRIPGQPWVISTGTETAAASPPRLVREAPTAGETTGGALPVASMRSLRPVTLWPLVLLAALFAAALIYVGWPGNLVYEKEALIDPNAKASQQAIDDGLKGRIAALKAELGKQACQANPALLGVPLNADPAQSDKKTENDDMHPDSVAMSGRRLIDILDSATVLVVTATGSGSGFFVTPNDILTNRHVIEGANNTVFVASKILGKAVRVNVAAMSKSTMIGNADFALLHMDETVAGVKPLQFATKFERNDNVIAGGFPFSILKEDSIYNQVLAGDMRGVSDLELVPTQGNILALPHNGTVQKIAHSASISPGNSGGPLIDACGRVVGINTFITTDDALLQKLNYSLSAGDAVSFLADNGVNATVSQARCDPQNPSLASRDTLEGAAQ